MYSKKCRCSGQKACDKPPRPLPDELLGECEVIHKRGELNNSSQFKPDVPSTAGMSFPGRLDSWVNVPMTGLASGTPAFSLHVPLI